MFYYCVANITKQNMVTYCKTALNFCMPLITQISRGKENCKSKACEYSYHLLAVCVLFCPMQSRELKLVLHWINLYNGRKNI